MNGSGTHGARPSEIPTEVWWGEPRPREVSTGDLLALVGRLERRLVALERVTYKRSTLATAVRKVIELWPGQFTWQMIGKAVCEYFPELAEDANSRHGVNVRGAVMRLVKQGRAVCVAEGTGPGASLFMAVSKSGRDDDWRFGRRDSYESGFRGFVRRAMDDLPEVWTIEDLRGWFREKAPNATVPDGTWSAAIYKMRAQREIELVSDWSTRNGKKVRLKQFRRGAKRVGPSGQELCELEEAWREFRSKMGEMKRGE